MRLLRSAGGALAAALALVLGGGTPAPASDASPPAATYSVTVGTPVPFANPTDTPATAYLDKDGTFHYQQSAALYGANDPRSWDFYTGTDFDTAAFDRTISEAVNPVDADDRNDDTTWRCNNSPTGREATYAPSGSGYAQRNYCDLSGLWVDPDTGDWYGLVHNEFTPQPFGDRLHYDAIDYAVSTDQGRTWTIKDHVLTSPYSTRRGDTTAFPQQTYHYGDGDQRLFVDTASGYFYVYYGSRIVEKNGGWKAFHEHVARAPISAKMAPGSWRKWYDGAWSQPGTGGRESNMVPVDDGHTTGYTPVFDEYDPATSGSVDQQVAAGKMPPTSPLFVMNVAYDAYLGLYIGEPQAVDQSGDSPQYFYATDDLATQKWRRIGDTGDYTNASWYRWFLDGGSRTGSTVVGRNFRSYCAFGCAHDASGEYVDVAIDSSAPAAQPVDTRHAHRVASGDGRVLAQVPGSAATTSVATPTGSDRQSWYFAPRGDGSYTISNAATHRLLGVDAGTTTDRAWGTRPTVTPAPASGPTVGQQWWVIPGAGADGTSTGTYRLVNRYSGLVLGLSGIDGRLAETTPVRDWTDRGGSSVGGGRTSAEQTLTLTPTGPAPETVSLVNPGAQSTAVGTAVSLRVDGADSAGKALTYRAKDLPPGLSISETGIVTGTPTTQGTTTVKVTAASGSATASASFDWTVEALLTGPHTLTTAGRALDVPDHSTDPGTQLVTWTPNGGASQSREFSRQPDGSYEITNAESHLCVDVDGGSTAAGAAIIQWTCTGGTNQRWTVTAVPDGHTLTSLKSGLLLTTARAADGAPVSQETDTGSALQHWSLG